MQRGTDVTDMKRSYRTAVGGEFPEELEISLTKEDNLRYGENPNQPAAMYKLKGTSLAEFTNIELAKSGKGGLSATNYMDVTRAMDILKFFKDPAVAVMKHLIPSGFARQYDNNELSEIYEAARDADARSGFGSVIVLNRQLDKSTAEAIISTYVEGVAAPDFEPGVMNILDKRKDLRVMGFSNLERIPKFVGEDIQGLYDLKALPTGRILVQKPYLSSIKSAKDFILDPMVIKDDKKYIVEKDPTKDELEDMLTAWYVNIGVRSNGIVFVKNGVTIAVGSGQQERVGAIEQAIVKGYQKAMDREGLKYGALDGVGDTRYLLDEDPLQGAVMSSDAFFPFRDSIDVAAECGVSAVVQPGGSVRDYEVIEATNKHKMAMAYTLERCFGHF